MASHSIRASVCHEAQRHLQQKMLVVEGAVQKRKILGLCYLHWMGMKIQLQCAHRDLTSRYEHVIQHRCDNQLLRTCRCRITPHFNDDYHCESGKVLLSTLNGSAQEQ